jgi:hypothetical protein
VSGALVFELVFALGVLLGSATAANVKLPKSSPPSEDAEEEAAEVKLDVGVAVDTAKEPKGSEALTEVTAAAGGTGAAGFGAAEKSPKGSPPVAGTEVECDEKTPKSSYAAVLGGTDTAPAVERAGVLLLLETDATSSVLGKSDPELDWGDACKEDTKPGCRREELRMPLPFVSAGGVDEKALRTLLSVALGADGSDGARGADVKIPKPSTAGIFELGALEMVPPKMLPLELLAPTDAGAAEKQPNPSSPSAAPRPVLGAAEAKADGLLLSVTAKAGLCKGSLVP